MKCPSCGAEIVGGGKFCENCGAPLGSAQLDAPQGVQPSSTDAFAGETSPYDSAYRLDQTEQFAQPYGSQQDQAYGGQGGYASYEAPSSAQPNAQAGYYGAAQPASQMPYSASPQVKQASGAPFVLAIIALVTALLGMFPVSLVLAIIALVMNSGQKKRGEVSTKQTPTFVMGIISLILSILMFILTLVFGGLVTAAVLNGDIDIDDFASSSSSASGIASSTSSSAASTSTSAATETDAAASSDDFVGVWEVELFEADGVSYDESYLEAMRNLGMKIEIAVNADGTASLDILDESEAGTWTDDGAGGIDFNFDGEHVAGSLVDGKLVMQDGTNKIVLHLTE